MFVQFREPGDVGIVFAGYHLRSRLDIVRRDSHDLRHRIDRTAHDPFAHVDDDCAGLFVNWLGLNAEQFTQVDDGNDRAAEITHSFNLVGNLRCPDDGFKNDDLLDFFDLKRILLIGQPKPDELGRVLVA